MKINEGENMGDTIKDKAEENKEQNEEFKEQKAIKTIPTPITLGNSLLAILVVLILITGSLVYYMIKKEQGDYEKYNSLVQNLTQDEQITKPEETTNELKEGETILPKKNWSTKPIPIRPISAPSLHPLYTSPHDTPSPLVK